MRSFPSKPILFLFVLHTTRGSRIPIRFIYGAHRTNQRILIQNSVFLLCTEGKICSELREFAHFFLVYGKRGAQPLPLSLLSSYRPRCIKPLNFDSSQTWSLKFRHSFGFNKRRLVVGIRDSTHARAAYDSRWRRCRANCALYKIGFTDDKIYREV